jgi:hypothetical protein
MIDNFKPIEGKKRFATVDVSFFGMLKRERIVYKDSLFWKWLDTGKFTPNHEIETLESKYLAENEFNK